MRQNLIDRVKQYLKVRKKKVRTTALLSLLSIFVAAATLFAMTSPAVTMEGRHTEDSSAVSADASAALPDDLQQQGSFAYAKRSEAPSPALHLAAKAAADAPVDLTNYITSALVERKVGANWESATQIFDGDTIRVSLSYTLPDGVITQKQKQVTYQLPQGIQPTKQQEGKVFRSGTTEAVGDYTVGTDGKILITFTDAFAAEGGAIEGTVSFEGEATLSGGTEDQEVSFGGSSSTITIRPAPTTDIRVMKTADNWTHSDGKIYYTVEVATDRGTADTVTVTDTLQTDKAAYDKDSFQIRKKANGQDLPLGADYRPAFSTVAGGKESFTYTGLPKLEAGQAYVITYTATPTVTEETLTIGNNVTTTSGGDEATATGTVILQRDYIHKTGRYDSNIGKIKWTITVNSIQADIGGWTLKDTLTGPDGQTVSLPETVTLVNKRTGEKEYERLPYTFPAGTTDTFEITYETTPSQPDIGATGNTYTNNATIEKDDQQHGDSDTVNVPKKDFQQKQWKSSETVTDVPKENGEKYCWETAIEIPEKGLPANKSSYTDTLGEHLTINSRVWDPFTIQGVKNGQATDLVANTDYRLTFYDQDGVKVSPLTENSQVKSFKIEFLRDIQPSAYERIRLTYGTYADYSWMGDAGSHSFINTAKLTVDGKTETDTARHEHKKNKPIVKQGSTHFGIGPYTDAPLQLDYDQINNTLYYRLLINQDKNLQGPLHIEDQLPEGTKLDGFEPYFYGNDYYCPPTGWSESLQKEVSIGDLVTHEVSDDGKKLSIDIQSGYENNAIVIFYSLSLADDTSWEDSQQADKTYINRVTMDKWTDDQQQDVHRTTNYVSKIGEQGNQDQGESPNSITYYVTLNPEGKDLLPDQDTLTLTDQLNASAIEQYVADLHLVQQSVKLYQYDESKQDGHFEGEQLDPSRYSYRYDQKTQTTTFTIPDGMALVLEYQYYFEPIRTDLSSLNFTNSVELSGVNNGQASTDTAVDCSKASATATRGIIDFYKVDSADNSKLLPHAQFTLQSYGTTSGWGDTGISVQTDANGHFALDRIQQNLTTGILYRLVETQPPDGYKAGKPFYFVWGADGQSLYQIKQGMNDTINSAGKDADSLGLTSADITFFGYGGGAADIANDFNGLTVQKLWNNQDGVPIQAPSDVDHLRVQLYRQAKRYIGPTVTVRAKSSGAQNTQRIQVKSGSDITINVRGQGYWNLAWTVTVGDKSEIRQENMDQGVDYTLTNITEDCTVDFTTTDWPNPIIITFPAYTAPTDAELAGERQKVGEPVTLNRSGGWSYTWTNLEEKDADGNTYFYSAEEVDVPEGFHVVAPHPGGTPLGATTTITNQRNSVPLPSTGGWGAVPYIAGGLLVMLAAGLIYIKKSHRKGGNTQF